MLTLVPALGHVGHVRIYPLAFLATTFWVRIGNALFEKVDERFSQPYRGGGRSLWSSAPHFAVRSVANSDLIAPRGGQGEHSLLENKDQRAGLDVLVSVSPSAYLAVLRRNHLNTLMPDGSRCGNERVFPRQSPLNSWQGENDPLTE